MKSILAVKVRVLIHNKLAMFRCTRAMQQLQGKVGAWRGGTTLSVARSIGVAITDGPKETPTWGGGRMLLSSSQVEACSSLALLWQEPSLPPSEMQNMAISVPFSHFGNWDVDNSGISK